MLRQRLGRERHGFLSFNDIQSDYYQLPKDDLIKIKKEIDKVKSGEYDKIDNPIKNAPHTDVELVSNDWKHKYSREDAAYPSGYLKENKFWPPVARVDNVYGDKNLFCSCPSMDEFKEDAA